MHASNPPFSGASHEMPRFAPLMSNICAVVCMFAGLSGCQTPPSLTALKARPCESEMCVVRRWVSLVVVGGAVAVLVDFAVERAGAEKGARGETETEAVELIRSEGREVGIAVVRLRRVRERMRMRKCKGIVGSERG